VADLAPVADLATSALVVAEPATALQALGPAVPLGVGLPAALVQSALVAVVVLAVLLAAAL
jgi:hypothetical protein